MNSKHGDKKKENFLKLSPTERHKKVLQVYYDLAKKDPLRCVSRLEAAIILGFINPDDDILLYEVYYLKDEGFLEIVELYGEKVTSYGINEVESGFPSFIDIKGKTQYIPEGADYYGRKLLLNILEKANKSIVLIDNFMDRDILRVVEPYLEKTDSIKFLTRKKRNSKFNSFSSDLKKFKKQFIMLYPNLHIKAKYNDKVHDRFIIIDDNNVYHSGHSLTDLGNKACAITEMSVKEEIDNFLDDFYNWWKTGTDI